MLESYPDVLTVVDLQEILSIGRTKTYELLHSATFPYIKVGKQIRIPKKYVIDYLSGLDYNVNESGTLFQERRVLWQ